MLDKRLRILASDETLVHAVCKPDEDLNSTCGLLGANVRDPAEKLRNPNPISSPVHRKWFSSQECGASLAFPHMPPKYTEPDLIVESIHVDSNSIQQQEQEPIEASTTSFLWSMAKVAQVRSHPTMIH
jgi:hypothetical protein